MPTKGGARRAAKRTDSVLPRKTPPYRVVRESSVTPITPERLAEIKARHARHMFRLVQCVEFGTEWFGGKFDLEPMGAAEYEFGVSDRSLARMRASDDIVIRAIPVTARMSRGSLSRTVYFIGPRDGFDAKLTGFRDWLENGCPSMLHSSFNDVFLNTERYQRGVKWMSQRIAWWSLQDDIMFTFREDVANQLLYGLEHPAVA